MPVVIGILLAAGTGTRFDGGNKLLADLDGEPVVTHAARTLAESPVDDVIAVLGHDGFEVATAIAGFDLSTVHNPHFAEGQGTTVARGARAADEAGADAAVFQLGDMPCVDPGTVAAVVEAFAETDAGIVVPTDDGERGNPALFAAEHFDRLQLLSDDTGGRVLFENHPVERVPVDDPGVRRDVDTVDDLDALRDDCR